MHRHGYKGRKLGRERGQRRALIKSLSVALIENGSIETTLPKAKELRPYFEKLITKAKKGGLHNRRQLISKIGVQSTHKLVDELAPMVKSTSGYLRIEKTRLRRGDNAQMATVSFVDEITTAPVAKSAQDTVNKTDAKPTVKTESKVSAKADKTPLAKDSSKPTSANVKNTRSGVGRGAK